VPVTQEAVAKAKHAHDDDNDDDRDSDSDSDPSSEEALFPCQSITERRNITPRYPSKPKFQLCAALRHTVHSDNPVQVVDGRQRRPGHPAREGGGRHHHGPQRAQRVPEPAPAQGRPCPAGGGHPAAAARTGSVVPA
jgi:hypothetical protein